MNSTLLEMSKSNYKAALLMYNNSLVEESHINFAAYHCQQSLELYLKHYLEINGVKYEHTHKIDILLDQVCDNSISLPINETLFKELDMRASGISSFEADTRYIKNFIVSKRRVKEILNLLEKIFVETDKYEDKVEIEEKFEEAKDIKKLDLH